MIFSLLTKQLLDGDMFLLWLLDILPCIPGAMELEYSLLMSSTVAEVEDGYPNNAHFVIT